MILGVKSRTEVEVKVSDPLLMAWSVGGNLMKGAERLHMIQVGMEMMET